MSFELEIFPTLSVKLRVKDIISFLRGDNFFEEINEKLTSIIKPVYGVKELNDSQEVLVDDDYEIKLNDGSILFFSVIENDDVFTEFDVLDGYNEKKISNESLLETSFLWRKIGYSFCLDLKNKKSDEDLRKFLSFSLLISEKTNGLLCIKNNVESLGGGLYSPIDFKSKLIERGFL